MKRRNKSYNLSQLLSAGFLIAALLWLTVSLPFVYESQKQIAKYSKSVNDQSSHHCNEEEASNPFGNTTEEKAPSSSNTSVSEEYLHDHHIDEYILSIASRNHKCENSGIYNAFHGEVHVPPPNRA